MKDWKTAVNPPEETIPEGYMLIPDDVLVAGGDVILDYAIAKGFAIVEEGGPYDELLGLTGHEARLHTLASEVFRKDPAYTPPEEKHERDLRDAVVKAALELQEFTQTAGFLLVASSTPSVLVGCPPTKEFVMFGTKEVIKSLVEDLG